MSLIDCYMKKFCKITKEKTPDGAGGSTVEWVESKPFGLAEMHDKTMNIQIADKSDIESTYKFLHDKKLNFKSGEYLKRKEDGQVFEVLHPSNEDYTPSISSLNLTLLYAKKVTL